MYTLLITTNKFTGKTSYYAKNDLHYSASFKRVTKENYRLIETMYKQWDCMHSSSNAKYNRQYKSVS